MDKLTVDDIKEQKLLLFECMSGSRAYGLAELGSDTDYKGVYIAPLRHVLVGEVQEQISEDNNNKTYFELGKFLTLLAASNPSILEMLHTPKESGLLSHPLMDAILEHRFLTKACEQTFAGYANNQIRKAKGLKKKVLNPVEPERKTVLDFCFVIVENGSVPLQEWLVGKEWEERNCGLTRVPHSNDVYALYHDDQGSYEGIVRSEKANDVSCSSVNRHSRVEAYLSYNRQAYAAHCKEYKEYWHWVEHRNTERYQNTLEHGKNYDAKNMMHTFRLLHMAEEIGTDQCLNVKRHDRDFLLSIKRGDFELATLLELAENKLRSIQESFQNSHLPERVDENLIEELHLKIRTKFYSC